MGREEGGGFRMGNIFIPVADYLNFKNKIKFKIFKKKKKDVRVNLQSVKLELSVFSACTFLITSDANRFFVCVCVLFVSLFFF